MPLRKETPKLDERILKHHRLKETAPGLCPFVRYGPLEKWMVGDESPYIVQNTYLSTAWPVWMRSAGKRPLVGLWCRRAAEEQIESLIKSHHLNAEDARWCVMMHENTLTSATCHIPTIEVWLDDEAREKIAVEWFTFKGFGVRSPNTKENTDGNDPAEGRRKVAGA